MAIMMTFEELFAFDRAYGPTPEVCGLDEAGRGPLAGPVFAACVVLKPDAAIPGLNDSKKLTEKKREAIFDDLMERQPLWYGIGAASHQEIDQINILQATFLAMNRAYQALCQQLPQSVTLALVDGNQNPGLPLPTHLLVKGDGRSAVIAAASVLAKVSRDRYMTELAKRYPQYDFDRHKGYGTAAHYQAIRQHGISPIHRVSFLKKLTGAR